MFFDARAKTSLICLTGTQSSCLSTSSQNIALRKMYVCVLCVFVVYVCVHARTCKLQSYCCISFQPVNQVVLWDKIILRGDSAYLDLSGAKTKYRFFDDGKGLK